MTDQEIDDLAYRFWSVHPNEIDEWEKTAPPMPKGYDGGMRAWFYASEMRKAFAPAAQEQVSEKADDEACDECQVGFMRSAPGGGIKCDKCTNWFCY